MGRRDGRSVPSARRGLAEARYRDYMASPAWWDRRRRWLTEHQQQAGTPAVCLMCETPWTLADDLHHVTYDHLGNEPHDDLWPLCRACHDAVHRVLDQWARARQSRLVAHHVAYTYLRQERLGHP